MSDLRNKTILLTRTEEENRTLADSFAARGARTISFPAIQIVDPLSWEACDRAISQIADYAGIFLTSAHAARKFLGRAVAIRPDAAAAIQKMAIYAVGAKTADAVRACGCSVAGIPATADAEHLGALLPPNDVAGRKFLFPRSDIARDVLPSSLRSLGAEVDEVIAYRNLSPSPGQQESVRALLQEGRIDLVTAFSPSAVRSLREILHPSTVATPLVAVGPTTAEAARAAGFTSVIVAPAASSDGVVAAVESYFLNR